MKQIFIAILAVLTISSVAYAERVHPPIDLDWNGNPVMAGLQTGDTVTSLLVDEDGRIQVDLAASSDSVSVMVYSAPSTSIGAIEVPLDTAATNPRSCGLVNGYDWIYITCDTDLVIDFFDTPTAYNEGMYLPAGQTMIYNVNVTTIYWEAYSGINTIDVAPPYVRLQYMKKN